MTALYGDQVTLTIDGEERALEVFSAAVAANQEATVTPDRLTKPSVSKTDDVAEVVVLDDAVAVVSPKNQLIMDTVKRCGFSWSPSAKRCQCSLR